jgi:hypothetical protein
MNDAYVETTVLTDLLLKPRTAKHDRAKAALSRYAKSLLPVYSIKEWKAGPLKYFAYLHDKLTLTRSLERTFAAIAALPRAGYLRATSIEAFTSAATMSKDLAQEEILLTDGEELDRLMADRYRLALADLIIRSWRKRRKLPRKSSKSSTAIPKRPPESGGTDSLTSNLGNVIRRLNVAWHLN